MSVTVLHSFLLLFLPSFIQRLEQCIQYTIRYVLAISWLYQCMSIRDRSYTSFTFPVCKGKGLGDCFHFSKRQLAIYINQRQSTDTPWTVDWYRAVTLWLRWQQKVNQHTDRVSTNSANQCSTNLNNIWTNTWPTLVWHFSWQLVDMSTDDINQ